MKTIIRMKIKRFWLFLLGVPVALLFVCQSSASGAIAAHEHRLSHEKIISQEMPRILPVLEEKIKDRRLVERSKEKLYGMGDREIRLISALCERIPVKDDSVSGDIAFFLVAALIVLS